YIQPVISRQCRSCCSVGTIPLEISVPMMSKRCCSDCFSHLIHELSRSCNSIKMLAVVLLDVTLFEIHFSIPSRMTIGGCLISECITNISFLHAAKQRYSNVYSL